jgi:hypothetical protein
MLVVVAKLAISNDNDVDVIRIERCAPLGGYVGPSEGHPPPHSRQGYARLQRAHGSEASAGARVAGGKGPLAGTPVWRTKLYLPRCRHENQWMAMNVTTRFQPDLREMLAAVADSHGRTPSAEVRIAVELHCVRVVLRQCEEAASSGDGDMGALARFKRRLEADLAHLEHVADGCPSSSEMYVKFREAQMTD